MLTNFIKFMIGLLIIGVLAFVIMPLGLRCPVLGDALRSNIKSGEQVDAYIYTDLNEIP